MNKLLVLGREQPSSTYNELEWAAFLKRAAIIKEQCSEGRLTALTNKADGSVQIILIAHIHVLSFFFSALQESLEHDMITTCTYVAVLIVSVRALCPSACRA